MKRLPSGIKKGPSNRGNQYYENDGGPHSYVLIVEHGGYLEDFIKEIFNYMVSQNIIAMYIDRADIEDLRTDLKGMLH